MCVYVICTFIINKPVRRKHEVGNPQIHHISSGLYLPVTWFSVLYVFEFIITYDNIKCRVRLIMFFTFPRRN